MTKAPTNYNDRIKHIRQLKPKDPYRNQLPPEYQDRLDLTYQRFVGKAMSNSSIILKSNQSRQTTY